VKGSLTGISVLKILQRQVAPTVLVLAALLLGGAAASALPGWHTNYAAAQAQALTERKLVLVHFSGSDWCGWCIKLQKDVFQKREFMDYARTNLVLLSVDFPKRKPMPRKQQESNQALVNKFHVEGFPTLLVLNEDGTKLGTLGFGEGGPKTFIKELEKFVARHEAAAAAALAATTPKVDPLVAARNAKVSRRGLELQGIVGKKGRRLAQINDLTLTTGQSGKVRVASGEVSIRCVEIRDTSVIVKVDGRREPLELKLTQPL
jgi:thioredoxin-related protein